MDKSKTPQDDRNLVEVTPEVPQPTEEERLALWWNAAKGYVFIAAAVFLVGAIGNQLISGMREGAVEKQQEAYLAALGSDSLADFAAQEADAPIGGFSYMQIAGDAYEAGDYPAAIAAYETATAALADTPLSGLAELGLAFSQAQNGNSAGASTIFQKLKADSYPESLRGEAAYALSILALEAGDDAALSTEAAYLRALTSGQIWISRLEAVAPGKI